MRVSGRIVFGKDAVEFSGATAHVFLEDTTYADAPAVALGSWRRDPVAYPADAAGVPFDFVVEPDPPERGRYTLRVLVDVDRDGVVGQGDYVNIEAIPVRRPTGAIEAPVKRVEA